MLVKRVTLDLEGQKQQNAEVENIRTTQIDKNVRRVDWQTNLQAYST